MESVGSKLRGLVFIIDICSGNKCTICVYLHPVSLCKYRATLAKWVNDQPVPEAASPKKGSRCVPSAAHFVLCVSIGSSSPTRTTATAWSSMFCLVRELAKSSSSMRTTGISTPPAAWTGSRRPPTSSKPLWSTRGRDRSWSRRPSSPSSCTTSTITSLISSRRSTRGPSRSALTLVKTRFCSTHTRTHTYQRSVKSVSLCFSGTSVIQVTATDADDGMYGNSAKLVYSISQGHPYFSVDPNTGRFQNQPYRLLRTTWDCPAVPPFHGQSPHELRCVSQLTDSRKRPFKIRAHKHVHTLVLVLVPISNPNLKTTS